MMAFKKIRPLHLFVASLVALVLSTVAGVLFGSYALAIIPIGASIALVGAWFVVVAAQDQNELREQRRDAYDSLLRATAAWASQCRQMNRADEVSRHLRLTEAVESELALYASAIVAAGRGAGAIGDREVAEPAQIARILGILVEEALNGNVLREKIRALVTEAQAEGAPGAWVSIVRLLAAISSSDGVEANAGSSAAPALLDRVNSLALQKAMAATLSPMGDPVSAEWIATHVNEHLANVGPTDPPVTAADVTREMGLWPRAIAVTGGKWRIK